MTVCLDHNMVNWLSACVHQFTAQEFTSAGCNLRSLLDWAWGRVGHIKESMDRMCKSLVVIYLFLLIRLTMANVMKSAPNQVSLTSLSALQWDK